MNKEQIECVLRALEQYEDNLRDTLAVCIQDEEQALNEEIRLTNEAKDALCARLLDYE